MKNILLALCIGIFLAGCSPESTEKTNETPNTKPTVNISGPASADESSSVTFTATANDSDGEITSYLWTQIDGPSVSILNSTSDSMSFTAPEVDADTSANFKVTVTDNDGAVGSATVSLTILDKVATTPADQLTSAKEFATGIYTMTDGVQNLFVANGVLDKLAVDSQAAASFYDQSANNVGTTLAISSASIAHVLIKAFSNWDGTLEGASPTGYDFDYSAIPASTSITSIPLVNDILTSQSNYTVEKGSVDWNSATNSFSVSLSLIDSYSGETTTATSNATLPANTSGTIFTYTLDDLNVSNQKTSVTFDAQPAVTTILEFYDPVDFATGVVQVPTFIDNPYLKFKRLSINSAKMNLDFTGDTTIRNMHFDGTYSTEIVRTNETNNIGGFLPVMTKLQFDGNFTFGDFTSAAKLDFVANNFDGLYLVETAIKHDMTNITNGLNYDEISSWINVSFDTAESMFTVTPNDLQDLGYTSVYGPLGYTTYPIVKMTIQETPNADPDIMGYSSLNYYIDNLGIEKTTVNSQWMTAKTAIAALKIISFDSSVSGVISSNYFIEWDCDAIGCYSTDHLAGIADFVDISEIIAGNSNGYIYPCNINFDVCERSASGAVPFTLAGATIEIVALSGDTLVINQQYDNWVLSNQTTSQDLYWLSPTFEADQCSACYFYGKSTTEIVHTAPNGETYTGGLIVEGTYQLDFTTGQMTGDIFYWANMTNTSAPEGLEYFIIGTEGLGYDFSFETQFKASSSSPTIGIATWWSTQNLNSSLQWLQNPTGALTAFKLSYDSNEILMDLDFDLNLITFSNTLGNVELTIEGNSLTDKIGSIYVDGLKQADIYESIAQISAVFIDGTTQLLAKDVLQ